MNTLRVFFEEPTREFHLRELARKLKKSPITIKKFLKPFVVMKLIRCKKERGLELYGSNSENMYYKEYKKVYNQFKLIESGLLDFLNNELNFPLIVVFGSYSKGEDNQNSDLDLFILTELKKQIKLDVYERKINRPIQLHIMNKKEFEKNKKENSDLINSILNGDVLTGFMEVL